MKNAAALHALEAVAVHKALGLGRVRHGQDHEIGARQQLVERGGAVQFGDPLRLVGAALVNPDHPHAE